jgi:hypothetical protein
MSNYVSPWDALEAIARMKITPDTNHAELCTLMIAIARRALDAAKINIIAITEAEMTDLDRFLLGYMVCERGRKCGEDHRPPGASQPR